MQEVSSITPGNPIVSRTYGMACDMWHRDMGKDIQIREVTISKNIVRQSQWFTQIYDNSHLMIDEG